MKLVKYQVGPDGKVVSRDIELLGGMDELALIARFFSEQQNHLLPAGVHRLAVERARPGAKFSPCIVVTVLLEEGQFGEQVEAEVRACLGKVLAPLAMMRAEKMLKAIENT